ncbi:DUF3316 domain-containing protein [Prevotella merdae]|uniref:DUF3316 domain-containing protein n=1 Tax=Prevotella merdae TaxID=2079531 RepID=UPI00356626F3
MKISKLISTAALLLGGVVAAAASNGDGCHNSIGIQQPQYKTNALMIGVGYTNILDTYLSPEKYRGTNFTFLSHTRRENDSTAWVNQFQHEGNVAYADNRSGNGGEMAGNYTFRYSLLHKWTISLWRRPLRMLAGGTAAANIGFVYNTRNGNNPANARLSLNIEPTIGFDYPIGRASHTRGISMHPGACAHFPFILHYEASAPLFGLMFSPNYGQSYYEIFNRGNYDHNCVPTTFGSTPSFRQMLTLDLRLAHTTWRIGYMGNYEQSHVNNIKTHTYTHSIVIGVIKRFRTVKE